MSKSIYLDTAAIIISLCALGVSINQAIEAERVNSASVFPHLDMTLIGGTGTDQDKGIRLDSAGSGPALIDDFKLYVDGELIEGKKNDLWPNAMKSLGFSNTEANDFRKVYFLNTDALKEGARYYLITPNLKNGESRLLTDDEWNNHKRLTIRIDYHGAFGVHCYVVYSPANLGKTTERTECIKA